MGGCRCTYRNCTVKTDGKTHMFHYPVFEKVRCHQWLVNAQRLEFLDLKVSQLKNRVVCQHHFNEENFMNYKKDKLTFDAIPTENGPYCDLSKFNLNQSQDKTKSYPNLILLEDIENEVIFNDKKANFSIKYGDFLTNGELMDSSVRYNLHKQELFKPRLTRLSLPSKDENKIQPQPMLVVPPYTDMTIEIVNSKKSNQDKSIVNIYDPNSSCYKSKSENRRNMSALQLYNVTQKSSDESLEKKEPKVKILSEKKIHIQNPIPIRGNFEKVSPSSNLNISDKNKEGITIVEECIKTNPVENSSNKVKVLQVLDVEFDGQQAKNEILLPNIDKPKIIETNIINATVCQPQRKTLQIKNKITSERSAAIEKKRNFNMKMKDILETCLDNLDDSIKIKDKVPSPIKTSRKSLIKRPIAKVSDPQVDTDLATDQDVQSSQNYTIAFLDARMKSMERTLLSKIEQNSQRILELKDSFVNVKKGKEPNEKKYMCAETNTSENCYKKFLYNEISQYLSPDSNNLIYEELFINKYAVVHKGSQRKRRRKYI